MRATSNDRTSESEYPNWTERYENTDVDLCRPHPLVLGMRFGYESEALERNIKENGQLDPCRAVRDEADGIHLLVYSGIRRLNAVSRLKSKFGFPINLKVIVDEDDLPDDELVKRALVEDVEENGQKLALSDLERISYCRNLLGKYDQRKTESILVSSGHERGTAKKIVMLVDKFDDEKIERLHKIEAKSNFTFKLAYLDLLLLSEDDESLYETASLVAFSQKPPEEIKTLGNVARHFSKNIPWFGDLFPEFVHGDEDEKAGNIPEIPDPKKNDIESSASGVDNDTESGALPDSVIVSLCHYCKTINPFRFRTGSPEFIFCDPKEDGRIEQLAVGATSVVDCERECPKCGKSYWITASVLEGGKIVVKTSSRRFIETPEEQAFVKKVYWDEKKQWMLYDEATKAKSKLDGKEVSN